MNWGKGIALVYITFVIGMLGLVYLAVSQDFDLVADDYYEQEIAYQGRIDQMTNAAADGQKVTISKKDGSYNLTFSEAVENVKVHFFRPSDDAKDFKMEEAQVESVMSVASEQLALGKYLVKVEWQANGKTYFQEQDYIVN